MNPLSQLYINWKFQKYISVSICHCHRAFFMKSLFIAYKNDEWCHFLVRIGSPAFISCYCVCVIFFYLSLFFLIFFCGVYYLLRYWGKFNYTFNNTAPTANNIVAPKFLSGVSMSWLLRSLVINITGLIQFGRNLSYILSPLAS